MHLITTKAHVEFLAKLDQKLPRKSGTDKQKTDVQYYNIDLHAFFHVPYVNKNLRLIHTRERQSFLISRNEMK